jgi:hypothetical protein
MQKRLDDGYLTTGELAELHGWSRQYALRYLKRRDCALWEFIEPCAQRLAPGKHHRFRIFDEDGLLTFCEMVSSSARDSRGVPRYPLDVEFAAIKHAEKRRRELLRKWVRGRRIRFVTLRTERRLGHVSAAG